MREKHYTKDDKGFLMEVKKNYKHKCIEKCDKYMTPTNKKEIKCEETHSACNKRIRKEGGKARCCYCVPHSHCEFDKEIKVVCKCGEEDVKCLCKSENECCVDCKKDDTYLPDCKVEHKCEGHDKNTCVYNRYLPAFKVEHECEGWIETFNTEFVAPDGKLTGNSLVLKDFIRKLLSQAREEMIEKIEKFLPSDKDHISDGGNCTECIYIKVGKDIISIIKRL